MRNILQINKCLSLGSCTGGDSLSKFKILLAAAVLLALVTLIMTIGNVSAGDGNGGVHGVIRALL